MLKVCLFVCLFVCLYELINPTLHTFVLMRLFVCMYVCVCERTELHPPCPVQTLLVVTRTL